VSESGRPWFATLAVVVALAVVLTGQTLADRVTPTAPSGALTGQTVGRAGFAYLTGLRVFAADLLWNRLDPLMDTYYRAHYGLAHMTFMLPSIEAIVALDPQFIDAYWVAPQIIIGNGLLPGTSPQEARSRLQTGLALAKQGVENNPSSGVLLDSYAQLLWAYGKDLKAAVPYAERAMRPTTVWRTYEEEFDSMAIARDIFKKAGMPARSAAAQAIMEAIRNKPSTAAPPQGS
jgi:hypothetical protein